MHARSLRRLLSAGVGALAGAAVGAAALLGATAATARHGVDPPAEPFLEATHLPPLLTAPDERVELRYDVYCGGEAEAVVDAPCDAVGAVFLRPGERGGFRQIPLRVDASASQGRYVANVPPELAGAPDGFSYYATFTAEGGAQRVVLPAGGAEAPQRSVPLGAANEVTLGRHAFGRTRAADARVAEAAWGDGRFDVGLEQGRTLTPIGGSSFDVDGSGAVVLLDEAHGRLLRWRGRRDTPSEVPLRINGTLADLAVARDGKIYVLESTGPDPDSSLLRVFAADGVPLAAGPTAERATQVRLGAGDDPVVLQEPSGQWMQAAADGSVLAPNRQATTGRIGRPLRGGGEVVVLRRGNEIRVALAGPNGSRRSWRIRSETAVAEVQLAEPIGGNVLLIARVYSDDRDEFVALELGERGLVRSFSLDSAGWAEVSPLSRFRLAGRALYRLGSTSRGVFVDRYDLEVR